jgi:integrase/recombinase XerD
MKVERCVETYLDQRRQCGYALSSTGKCLRRFARFVGKLNISVVADHHLDAFLSRTAISNNTWRRYSGYLHRFFVFWFAYGQTERIPKPKSRGRNATIFYPHVYTRKEIRRLLDATTVCQRAPVCTLGPETLRTLVLFLYGTGVKLREALRMSDSDVHLASATILMRGASESESRVIPIGRDVKRLLGRYLRGKVRSRFGAGRPLFLTMKGTCPQYSVLCKVFRRLRCIAKVERRDGPYQPRIYDLRHTFAVHSIAQWDREGIQLDTMLPLLATYMGNVDLLGVERYLELSPCSYQSQLKRLKV